MQFAVPNHHAMGKLATENCVCYYYIRYCVRYCVFYYVLYYLKNQKLPKNHSFIRFHIALTDPSWRVTTCPRKYCLFASINNPNAVA